MESKDLAFLQSWPVIILACIVFWPAGLFLMFRKFATDKKAALSAGGKVLKLLGIVLAVVGGLAFLGNLSDFDFGAALVSLFLAAGGAACILKAKKYAAEAEDIKRYLSIVVNGRVRQLDAISASTGKPYSTVRADLQKMIEYGYFKNAYIDDGIRELVLPSDTPAPTGYNTPTEPQHTARVVSCPCCGANNTIYGQVGECEYCGSTID